VFKKGAAGSVTNYRPISLTCITSKIMERIKSIYNHLLGNNLLSCTQHGFVRGRSTCTNLLEALNDWTLTVHNKKSVTVAYIDFSRAFDSVSQEKLLVRLYSYGGRGNVLQWMRKFFHGRSHQTRVGEALSTESSLLS